MLSVETYRDIVSGTRHGALAASLRGLLRLASLVYGTVTAIRSLWFDRGWRRITAVDVPVISIGNLTTGGTGKTPMVATVIRLLQQQGRTPGIISRGYRADSSGANDELRVLEHLCPGVPHIQNPDRVVAARQIITGHAIDVIVLDDAFQHRRIHRDLDLVLIDATNPFGYGALLPRGLLREPIRGLRRADQLVITRYDQVSESRQQEIEDRLRREVPQLEDRLNRVAFRPTALLDADGTVQPLSRIDGCRVLILTAIGNPQGFVDTCRAAGADIIRTRLHADHHHYTTGNLTAVLSEAREHGVDLVLTTVKDLVKIRLLDLPAPAPSVIPILAVEIATAFHSADEEQQLQTAISRALATNSKDKG